MSNIVYFNGHFVPETEAKVSVFDRGFLFSDSVYEVSCVLNGKLLVDNPLHFERLKRSLNELDSDLPFNEETFVEIQKTLIEKNHLQEGGIYIQVTRGEKIGQREFTWDNSFTHNVVMFVFTKNLTSPRFLQTGLKVICIEDLRWQRRDIKTTQLLSQCLAKQAAKQAGVDETWLVDQAGYITEGSSNNAFLIQGNIVITHPVSSKILNGITRRLLLEIIKAEGFTLEERPFYKEDIKKANEAFITSATTLLAPVVQVDAIQIKDGQVGSIALKLRKKYLQALLSH